MSEDTLNILQLAWIFFSFITLGKWLLRHNYGRSSLDNCQIPQNNLDFLDMVISLLVFMGLSAVAHSFIKKDTSFLDMNLVWGIGNLMISIVLLMLLGRKLTNGLRSIFPAPKLITRDIFIAFCYSVPATGLAFCAFAITIFICSEFGYDRVQQHEFLTRLMENRDNTQAIIVMYLSTAVLTPIVEETLFRGIIQTTIIKYTDSNWLGIFLTATFFAVIHANPQHFAALMFLGGFFGYSFVKSRSLLIPITMHAVFNAIIITGTMLK